MLQNMRNSKMVRQFNRWMELGMKVFAFNFEVLRWVRHSAVIADLLESETWGQPG